MSNGIDFSTLGKITTLFETTLSVRPSAGERASACRPTMPPAPGWLSTITGWPRALASAAWAARVMASTPEPVAFGRMNLTGLSLWAKAGAVRLVHRLPARPASSVRRFESWVIVCLSVVVVRGVTSSQAQATMARVRRPSISPSA